MSPPAEKSTAMTDGDFELLHIERDAGVVFATIDAPPINVMTPALFRELAKFSVHVADDDSVRVVVLRSDNPDFFIAHFDVTAILGYPTDGPAERPTEHVGFHAMCETYRTMPKATIVEIGGRVGGGGSELSMSCDMRFGALDRTVINQMEVPIGILPGGTGTQRLPRLVGRGRAMEVILGGVDLDARRAEHWGYLNRALPADELRPFVTDLAYRIAKFPPQAVALAKQAVNAADELPLREGMFEERYLFQRLLRTPQAQPAMEQFLELGGQTRDGEMRVGDLVADISTDG
ncbi:MAG: enoyl-CoA hydratase/isomerase family protein [Acidimicrobiaceae bacterium]|nr:enoyl-CoA hydratase/isomerase family protein [Acidimicrobiaceae bacterium]MCY3947764.1 enoyl-CoA hydratase/isomerase family protein [Acidimicrobiaceae bacterium]MDE0320589.1 enoyl-CoA hydratase/isomerase family protein [Acidimicrobiaceae bacterium]